MQKNVWIAWPISNTILYFIPNRTCLLMFAVLLRVFFPTRKTEKYASPRWESNLRPLEC